MKKWLFVISVFVLSSVIVAQDQPVVNMTDSAVTSPPKQTSSLASKIYYGGNIGFNFGNYTRISAEPLVGYKVTPKFSVGAKLRYEWIRDKRYDPTLTTSNYGGSIFSRYRIISQLYVHAEFAAVSYEYYKPTLDNLTNTEREMVPFLLLGGGYTQRLGNNTWAYVEALFDVLQDENSPYEEWEPFISVGVGVGF